MPKQKKTDLEEALDALEQVRASLANWIEIQDKEDAREYDNVAMRAAARVLKKHGRTG